MKWVYRILRLFFCPHKYVILSNTSLVMYDKAYGFCITSECKYCGKIKIVEYST